MEEGGACLANLPNLTCTAFQDQPQLCTAQSMHCSKRDTSSPLQNMPHDGTGMNDATVRESKDGSSNLHAQSMCQRSLV